MGCNCGRSNTASLKKTGSTTNVASNKRTISSAVCMNKYDELALLDRKIIALHKKFRLDGEASKRYADMQKMVRGWIIKLKEECPNQDDLLELSEYVNTEYDNYFTVR